MRVTELNHGRKRATQSLRHSVLGSGPSLPSSQLAYLASLPAPREKTQEQKNEKCRQGARTSAMRQRVRAKHLAQNKDFGPGAQAAGGVKCRPSRTCLIMHFVRMYLCLRGPIIHCRRMHLDLCGSYGTSHHVYYTTTQGHQHTCVFVFACFIWYITSCILHCTTTQGHQHTTRGPSM